MLTSRRQRAFADQLEDSLQLMSSGLRAGHSLLQALDGVSQEMPQPASEEFARIINETRVGRDLAQALDETAARTDSKDFAWVAHAIAINRQVGGNLAEVLDTVGGTIRERGQIRRQVKALSAEGKLSAIVLMALPFGVTGFLTLTNPGYLAKFTESLVGYGLIGAGRRAADRRRTVAPQGHHPEVLTNHVPQRKTVIVPAHNWLAIGLLTVSLPLLVWAVFSRPTPARLKAVANLRRGVQAADDPDDTAPANQAATCAGRWRGASSLPGWSVGSTGSRHAPAARRPGRWNGWSPPRSCWGSVRPPWVCSTPSRPADRAQASSPSS